MARCRTSWTLVASSRRCALWCSIARRSTSTVKRGRGAPWQQVDESKPVWGTPQYFRRLRRPRRGRALVCRIPWCLCSVSLSAMTGAVTAQGLAGWVRRRGLRRFAAWPGSTGGSGSTWVNERGWALRQLYLRWWVVCPCSTGGGGWGSADGRPTANPHSARPSDGDGGAGRRSGPRFRPRRLATTPSACAPTCRGPRRGGRTSDRKPRPTRSCPGTSSGKASGAAPQPAEGGSGAGRLKAARDASMRSLS